MPRPQFDQPVLAQSNGTRWWIQVSNAGILQVVSPTDAPLTPTRRICLVDANNVAAFRLGISDDTPPMPTLTPLRDSSMGNHMDLPIWSPNGREWTLGVTQLGEIMIEALSSNWPMLPSMGLPTYTPGSGYQFPFVTLQDGTGTGWQLLVNDSGIWSLQDEDSQPIRHRSTVRLWTQDDSTPFQVIVDNDGLLTVTDAPTSIPKLYEAVLCSPGGSFWTLVGDVVAGDVILSITDTLQQALNNRDEWPLVVSQHGNYLYIADDRFPSPVPGMPRRWGSRRRMPRRKA